MCYILRDNSYTRPTTGNSILSIATSTITMDHSQLSSTERCKDCDGQECQYYPRTWMTDENQIGSLPLTIKERIRSSPWEDAIQRRSLVIRKKILWSDTRCQLTISANTYSHDHVCNIEPEAFRAIDSTEVDWGRANGIWANLVTNPCNTTNADRRWNGHNYTELDECPLHGGCGTQHLVAIRNIYHSWTIIKRPAYERFPNWSCSPSLTSSHSVFRL